MNTIVKYLTANKYVIVASPQEANYIMLTTCCSVDSVTDKSLAQIAQLLTYDAELIILGCLPDTDMERMKDVFKGRYIRNVEMEKIDELFGGEIPFSAFIDLPVELQNGELSLEICRGCIEQCSYCIIRKAIGPLKSKSLNYCVEQVMQAIKNGAKKIVIGAENVGAYGKDINTSFSTLLRAIEIPDQSHMLRINNLNPKYLKENQSMIMQLSSSGKLGLLKTPIQSGSQKILDQMRRLYDINEVKNILLDVKKNDESTITMTDIIIGFPGETQADFSATLSFVLSSKIDIGRVFTYTAKKGTLAAEMENQISEPLKVSRLRIFNEQLSRENYIININDDIISTFSRKRKYETNNPFSRDIGDLFCKTYRHSH